MKTKIAKDILFGLAVGDALGVPVEFLSREVLEKQPVEGITGGGTHGQPEGTWSDDSSLAFCLAESLCNGYDIDDIARNFIRWYDKGWWSAHGEVFDIGIATQQALERVKQGVRPVMAGGREEYDNGNGSLMRIMPLLALTEFMYYHQSQPYIAAVSSVTHAHPRSVLACSYLLILAAQLRQYPVKPAMIYTQGIMTSLMKDNPVLAGERHHFQYSLFEYPSQKEQHNNPWEFIRKVPREEIRSSGYVAHTLEASLWCLATTDNYRDAVLKAVNLGEDTDTTAAVTGALAGVAYGFEGIPAEWVSKLVRKDDILNLSDRLDEFYMNFNFRHSCPACG